MNNIYEDIGVNQEIHDDNVAVFDDSGEILESTKASVKKIKKLKKEIKFQLSELRNDTCISEKIRKKRIKQLKTFKKHVETEMQRLKRDMHQLKQGVSGLNVRVNKLEKYHADVLVDRIINMSDKKSQHEAIMRLIRGVDDCGL